MDGIDGGQEGAGGQKGHGEDEQQKQMKRKKQKQLLSKQQCAINHSLLKSFTKFTEKDKRSSAVSATWSGRCSINQAHITYYGAAAGIPCRLKNQFSDCLKAVLGMLSNLSHQCSRSLLLVVM